MPTDYSGKVALITGGSTGIGRATALQFAAAGAKVAIADVNEAAAEETVQAIKDTGAEAIFIKTDVSQEADVIAMLQTVLEAYGRLDCAFNNAGISGASGPLHDYSFADYQRVIDINLSGVWLCMKYEIGAMLQGGGGAIVNTSSVLGLVATAGLSPYVAAKHGVLGLTREAGVAYAKQNIRVNCVNPGWIRTQMTVDNNAIPSDMVERWAARSPIGRMAEPDEVAHVVLFLCSDEASFITASAYTVDGGLTAI